MNWIARGKNKGNERAVAYRIIGGPDKKDDALIHIGTTHPDSTVENIEVMHGFSTDQKTAKAEAVKPEEKAK